MYREFILIDEVGVNKLKRYTSLLAYILCPSFPVAETTENLNAQVRVYQRKKKNCIA